MLIAVAGATGTLGRHVAAELAARGNDVRALSRRPPPTAQAGQRHVAVDLRTGAGLDAALDGVEVVVDAANRAGTGRQAAPVLVDGTRRLLEAEARAGVGHHVEISIVGVERTPFSYHRVKLAQERIVEQGPVAWSIVRATQFHELLDWGFGLLARVGLVPANAFALAPVDARVAASVLADAAEAAPGGHLAPVAGPQVASLRDLAREWARARGSRPLGLPLPLRPGGRRALAAGALVPGPEAETGGPTFAQWLRDRAPAAAAVAS